MNECKVNVNVSSVDTTCTQTSTWPSLCVEKFIYVKTKRTEQSYNISVREHVHFTPLFCHKIYPSYPDIDNCCFWNVKQAAELKLCLNVSSVDTTCTQTSTWPSLCVEKFIYDPPGIMFYTWLQTYEVFIFVLATLGNAVYELNYL
jgi:hypothetical protein